MKRLLFLFLLFAFGCAASTLQWEYTSTGVGVPKAAQSADLGKGWIFGRCELFAEPSLEGQILAAPAQGTEVEIRDRVKGDNGLDFTLVRYVDPINSKILEGYVYSDFVTTERPTGNVTSDKRNQESQGLSGQMP